MLLRLSRIGEQRKNLFFDPIPTKIKSLVFQLISTQVYSFSTLQKYLSFTHSQLKSIKSQFSDNNDKLIKQHQQNNKILKTQTPTNTQSNPDFLPFKVVPHDSTTFNQASDSNYSNCKQLKNTLNNTNASDYHSINITADDGAQLNLPAHLSSDLILNIIKLFLCSK